jgi:hypothetical protein
VRECTEAVFLRDVANHSMRVLMDSGTYRHLRFANKDKKVSWNQWFEIITWPGYLAYSGDMGTFVFARIEDMFEFFRMRPSDEKEQLHVNLGYWGEKLQAIDRDHRNNSEKAFSIERLRERVEDYVKDWIEEERLTDEQQAELREEIREHILSIADDGEYVAHQALREFSCEIDGHIFQFSDTWEWDLREYTFRFVWCCYAVAWAVRQYDQSAVPA